MKKAILLTLLLAPAAWADLSDVGDAQALLMCDGAEYFSHQCDELGSPSPCGAGADPPALSPTDPLPRVTRLESANERGTCQKSDSATECDVRLSDECVSRSKRQGLCEQQDSDQVCESAGIGSGLCSAKDRDAYARLASCRSFLDSKVMEFLGKERDKGRDLEATNSLPETYKDDDITTTP